VAAAARAATVRTQAAGTVSTPATFTTTKSEAIFAEAQLLMPGGVSSPVRAFKSVGGGPVVFDRVKGAYAWDVDGNKYVDYIGTWGPAICGACNDEVRLRMRAHCPPHPRCSRLVLVRSPVTSLEKKAGRNSVRCVVLGETPGGEGGGYSGAFLGRRRRCTSADTIGR